QAASPTTFGKEMAVFASRLGRAIGDLREADDALQAKVAGASGTYAAHELALPDVDWPAFATAFVTDLGFDHVDPVTQVNPGDDLARVFHALERINGVLLDAARDAWQYTSDGYLRPTAVEGVGSSTMPQKVNPIDFENAEGNLEKATSDLAFLARSVQTSRLQRDLSDSTVKRGIGTAFAHCLLAYTRLRDGFASVTPDAAAMAADLEAHPEVLAEAIQTVARREGIGDAYERVADATQGKALDRDALGALIEDLDLPASVRDRLLALEPADYLGVAPALADLADEDE
ncbi:MAG: lyase family protein, partial [Halobacteriaceae archaeon]